MCRLPRPGPELEGRRLVGGDPGADQPRFGHRVGGQPAAELARRRARRGRRAPSAAPARRARLDRAPIDDAAARDPDRVEAPRGLRVRREHEPRAGVRRAQDAAEALEQRLEPARAGAAATPRARSAARPRPPWSGGPRARAAPCRRRGRRTAPAPRPAARGRGSDRGRAGRATGSGPSARRPTGCSRRGSVRPQWRRPNSELSCSTSSAAAARPRTGPTQTAWPAAGSRATSRIGNGMSSRQRR